MIISFYLSNRRGFFVYLFKINAMKKILFFLLLSVFGFGQGLNGYEKFSKIVPELGKVNYPLTVFVNIDYLHASSEINYYLQTTLDYSPADFKENNDYTLQKYIKKVSSTGKESITIKYKTFNVNDRKCYIDLESGICKFIESVEIYGSKMDVIKLFVKYWPNENFNRSDKNNNGEVASKQFLGDKITLYNITPTVSKIIISKGNIDFKFYEEFGINKKK